MASILNLPGRAGKKPSLTRPQRSALRRIEHWRRQTADHLVSVGGGAEELRSLTGIAAYLKERVTGGGQPKITERV